MGIARQLPPGGDRSTQAERIRRRGRTALLAALLLSGLPVKPASALESVIDIKRMSIEQLMNIPVTTPQRHETSLHEVPAAVYVLTAEDIRRARVNSVPDALRLVPGVEVASLDANKWAVSIRGFQSRTANKLLVLVDGRSVYDPLFSGVFWESNDVMLETIDRIEVVRGPGGALWGANAVNGVINIVTRNARDSQGALITAGAGTGDAGLFAARHGWMPADGLYARVYAKGLSRGTGFSARGAHDDARQARAGFRLDGERNGSDRFTLQGNIHDGTFGEGRAAGGFQDVDQRGGNATAGWTRSRGENSETGVRVWYERFELHNLDLGEKRDTVDFEMHHSLRATESQHVVLGAGYRYTRDDIRDGPILAVRPGSRRDDLYSAFVQNEIDFAARTLRLTLGVKVERNDYSGTEWQPNARMAWVPNARNTVWGAISRAVRTPSRLESDVVSPIVTGNRGFDSERLVAFEAGFRTQPTDVLSLDLAVFYNVYDKLLTIENTVISNRMEGHGAGFELAGRWQVRPGWRLDAGYSELHMDLRVEPGSGDAARAAALEGADPRRQFVVGSLLDVTRRIEFEAFLRYAAGLGAAGVPSYLVMDLGLGWHPRPGVELSLAARNLFDSHHPEQATRTATEVRSDLSARIRWEF